LQGSSLCLRRCLHNFKQIISEKRYLSARVLQHLLIEITEVVTESHDLAIMVEDLQAYTAVIITRAMMSHYFQS
jgi:hypothetical protein